MRKQGEDNSDKFMGGSHDRLSERKSVLFSFKEISPKDGIHSDDINSHQVYEPSQVAVSPFRDSAFAFKRARLKDGGVNTGVSDQGLMRGEVVNTANFGKEGGASFGIDAVNRGDDFKLFGQKRLTAAGKQLGNLSLSFQEMQERGYFTFEYGLLGDAYCAYRGLGCFDERFSGEGRLSPSGRVCQGFGDGLGVSGPEHPCRRELLKEREQAVTEDIGEVVKFREGGLEDSLDFILSGGDEITEGFPFSGNISEVTDVVLGLGFRDGVVVGEEEFGDGVGVLFIGLGLSQRELSEVGDEERVNNNCGDGFCGEKGAEIDVITAGRFHSGDYFGGVFTGGGDGVKEFREAIATHPGGEGEGAVALLVKPGSREGVLGDIDPDEKIKHTSTSIRYGLSWAGAASRPILHDDEGSLTQSTYHGYGRRGTNSFEGSMTQEKWSSPAFPFLVAMGKTHPYYIYNTNS